MFWPQTLQMLVSALMGNQGTILGPESPPGLPPAAEFHHCSEPVAGILKAWLKSGRVCLVSKLRLPKVDDIILQLTESYT